ncbi:unnamed protein product, partial [Staurois parvus]
MPPASAHQCHINATYQCLPVHISAHLSCLSVPTISASQCCQSVPRISASQCCQAVPPTSAHQCCLT